ncbi:helix-turn-helix transcriptional regulator [Anderseniella sp. Alg231-50]|uniref:helix-turn-helix transcriptional regulator n=1 Tax=Anderseniella sp. Alg231-50 TaxID=1922226 RepID=UPI00307C76D1
MPTAFEDFADQMINLPDADEVWQCTAEFGHNLGFSSCSLTMAERTQSRLESRYLRTDLGNEFSEAYTKGELIDIDPFLLFSCHKPGAGKVLTRDLSSFPESSPKHQEFLDRVAQAGNTGGIGIPVRTSENQVFGGWMFSSREPEETFHKLVAGHGQEAHLAGLLAYERMVSLGLGREANEKLLSGREREVLLWLCAGCRVSMIADQLAISESAVNLYIKNARAKLGAKTREQAVARAILSGQIEL